MEGGVMQNSHTLDLTEGSVVRKILLFFLPILASSLFQQLYNTMDAIIVGQIMGKTGLAAIDAVVSMMRLPVNFFNGIASGSAIILSQAFGAGSLRRLSDSEHTAAAFAIVFGAFLSLVGVLVSPGVLHLMSVPSEIYPLTLSYTRIYFAGLLFSLIYNIGAGTLQAVGNTRIPFRILVISGLVNIVLDYLFVGPFHMGVGGAALATVIAQALSSFLVVRALILFDGPCRLNLRQIRFHREPLKRILSIGLPTAFQNSVWPIANIFVQGAMNSMGTDYIASWGLLGKMDLLLWLCIDSFGTAITTYSAQNIGAGKTERMKKGVAFGMAFGLGMVVLISCMIFFFAQDIGKLFINADSYDILPLMNRFARFLGPLYWAYVPSCILAGSIQGSGEAIAPMIISLTGTALFRIVWILFWVPSHHTPIMVASSYPISWILTSSLFALYWLWYRKSRLNHSLHD